ncbi:hypothetical protein Hypma_002020 [Hypsizygus marmoreus]|uniref:Uncharacterized protein n=1 Tax=Hypsizygus marmoreus TaxID=39966 RepID=A0A369JDU8_HYPMA|nr:hypothetical protein Hypma_002020 [Hypsizygus marmoreus]
MYLQLKIWYLSFATLLMVRRRPLTARQRASLFDWDISKTGNVGPPRLGTWQFMAIRLLQYTDERRAPSL